MHYSIDRIEGIGPEYRAKLVPAGIRSTRGFLKLCCHKKGRGALAKETGISEKLLLRWANHADLMRITGIGPQFSELLEAAGVDTVKELKTRKPEHLQAKMAEVNAQRKLTRVTPPLPKVQKWVAEAKGIKPAISH